MERLVHGDALVAVEGVRALREQALDQLPFGARLPRIEGRRVKDASDVGSEVRVEKRRVAIRSTSIQIVVDAVAKVPEQRVERLAIPVTVAPGRRIRTGLAGYPRGLFEVRKKPFARFSVFLFPIRPLLQIRKVATVRTASAFDYNSMIELVEDKGRFNTSGRNAGEGGVEDYNSSKPKRLRCERRLS